MDTISMHCALWLDSFRNCAQNFLKYEILYLLILLALTIYRKSRNVFKRFILLEDLITNIMRCLLFNLFFHLHVTKNMSMLCSCYFIACSYPLNK